MKFLIDAQLPPALAQWLREAGHDVQHVDDIGLRGAEDGAIWAHALQTGVVVVTKPDGSTRIAVSRGRARPHAIAVQTKARPARRAVGGAEAPSEKLKR